VLREDAGEIDVAEDGALPQPIGDVIGDFHVHTSSRATALVARGGGRGRRARAAAACSRSPSTPRRRSRGGREEHARAARTDPGDARALGDSLLLLHGVELNIGRDGELDYDAEFRRSFDWCLASVHDHFELGRAEQTRRVVTAMRDPSVRMIGISPRA
jgi:DNA polymerase (family 10)